MLLAVPLLLGLALNLTAAPDEADEANPPPADTCAELDKDAEALLRRALNEQTRRFAKRVLRKRRRHCIGTGRTEPLCQDLENKAAGTTAPKEKKRWTQLAAACKKNVAAAPEAATPTEDGTAAGSGNDPIYNEILETCDTLVAAAAAAGSPPGLLREARRCRRLAATVQLGQIIDNEKGTFRGALADARRARCATAICWGPSNKWAVEPLVELPIGKAVALPTSGSLAAYVNSSTVDVSVSAGIRFWLWWDWVSVSIYLSRPLIDGADTVPVKRTGFLFPRSQIRRPLPGLGVGLFGDVLWLGVDYDQLRNGQTPETMSTQFPPNEVVSHAVVFSFAIAPLAGIRNGLGTLAERKRKKDKDREQNGGSPQSEASGDQAPDAAPGKPAAESAPDTGPPPTDPPPAEPTPSLFDRLKSGFSAIFS